MTPDLSKLALAPLDALLQPESRLYWPGLLFSLLLTAFFLRRTKSERSLLKRLFPHRFWTHPSTQLDLKLLLVDLVRRAVVAAPLALWTTAVTLTLASSLQLAWEHPHLEASPLQVSVAYALVLLLVDDATRYLLHRALHRLPWLMKVHAVHHSAELMSPLTLKRIHPIEGLLYSIRYATVAGVVTGFFFYFFRSNLNLKGALAAHVALLTVHYGLANLRHSPIWLSYGSLVERLLISPAQHQLHHSRNRALQNQNYGSIFAVWDLLGGTWSAAGQKRRLRFGLKNGSPASNSFWHALLMPLRFPSRSRAIPAGTVDDNVDQ